MRNILSICAVLCASSAVAQNSTFVNPDALKMEVIEQDNMLTFLRGDRHPIQDGFISQYENLSTRLRGNLNFIDVLTPTDEWHLYDGSPIEPVDLATQTPENYHDTHNHHQSILSEVVNYTPGTNGIPFWGDSHAAVNGAGAWGAFVSARSSCLEDNLTGKYAPPGIDRGCGDDFDAQLTGLEVDVLNGGKPGVFPNKAKHGVQVVGFGNPNGQAFSVIVENFDREKEFQRGHFESILYAQNALHKDYGRFVVADFDEALIGLDFRKPIFSEGAARFNVNGVGTGVVFNDGQGGEIYAGERWQGSDAEDDGWLTIRSGANGVRVVSNDNTNELFAIDKHGGIYLNGDIFFNNVKISDKFSSVEGLMNLRSINWISVGSLLANVLLLVGFFFAFRGRVKSTKSTKSTKAAKTTG